MLFERWTVYGRAAGSLMTGDYSATVSEFNNNGATPLTNVNQSFRKITPVAEMAFGVAYQGEHLRLSLGYEITNWFSLVDTPSFVDDVQQGKSSGTSATWAWTAWRRGWSSCTEAFMSQEDKPAGPGGDGGACGWRPSGRCWPGYGPAWP